MTKYIFHSERTKTTCNECKKHDGRVFYDVKDIPKLPIHPNCKCWIETVEDKKPSNSTCDCTERLEVLQNNVENVITNLNNMLKSVSNEIYESEIKIGEIKENDNDKKANFQSVQNKLMNLKTELETFIKKSKDLSTDIEFLKDNSNEFTHLKEECGIYKELNSINDKSKAICKETDRYSETLKELKEEIKKVGKEKKAKGVATGGAASFDKAFEESKKKVHAQIVQNASPEQSEDVYNVTHPAQKTTDEAMIEKKAIFEKNVATWENNIESSKSPLIGKMILSSKGADAAGMLNISEGKKVPIYTKDAVKIDNIGDSKFNEFNNGDLKKWQPYMISKIQDQFDDFDYKLEDIEGYIFKNNSAPVKRIKNSEDFKRILNEHKKEILNGERFSGRFLKNQNLYKAFASVDFMNSGFDNEGNLHLYMFDTYDFNKGENALVEAGRRQMLKGNLKGFFTVHEIIIKKEELTELWD